MDELRIMQLIALDKIMDRIRKGDLVASVHPCKGVDGKQCFTLGFAATVDEDDISKLIGETENENSTPSP